MTTDDTADRRTHRGRRDEPVDVDAVREAAVEFVERARPTAFGFETTVDADVDGTEIEVRVDGPSLGLLIGPGGRTLLGDPGPRPGRRPAPPRRPRDPAARRRRRLPGEAPRGARALRRHASPSRCKRAGVARSLDPMPSADRKVLHDALAAIDGVTSRSEGEDPEPPRRRRPRLTSARMDDAGAARRRSARRSASGMLGDRPIAEVIEHAGAFVAALADDQRARSSTSAAAAACPAW